MAVAALATHAQTLLDLEARHEELLHLIDELEQRVAKVLAEHQPSWHGEVGQWPIQAPETATGAPSTMD